MTHADAHSLMASETLRPSNSALRNIASQRSSARRMLRAGVPLDTGHLVRCGEQTNREVADLLYGEVKPDQGVVGTGGVDLYAGVGIVENFPFPVLFDEQRFAGVVHDGGCHAVFGDEFFGLLSGGGGHGAPSIRCTHTLTHGVPTPQGVTA